MQRTIEKTMKSFKLAKKTIFRHLIIWALISAFLTYIDHEEGCLLTQILVPTLCMLGYMFIYYMEYLLIFPKFYQKNLLMKMILGIVITLVLFEFLYYFIFYHLIPMLGDKNHYDGVPVYVLILNCAFLFFFTSIVAFGSYQSRVSKMNIRAQNAKEKALLVKQLGFLKNQFNPHITFNFLTYCYSHIHKESKEGAEAIGLFSGMLHHTLDRNPDEPVPLEKEVEYIFSYINLQKILHKKIQVNFQITGDLQNKYIVPRICINFVENAFKHGDTESIEFPITIKLEIEDELIKLYINNKKRKKSKLLSTTGVGNSNSVKQLEFLYKNNYEYSYSDEGNFYSCKLFLTNKTVIG